MDVSNKYVQLNTQLTTEQATVIPAMNGRQGDNNRQVFFQVKDGDMNHNLSGQTVQLAVMDSKEVPKVLSGAYTVDNAAIGRFSLMIPWNFYQAAGDSVQGYIRFLEGDTVVSSIPIQYTVYQNRINFTQTESTAFLSDVDDMVSKANAKFEPIEQKLSAAQTASKILTDSVDSLNESIDKNRVALKNVDNTFTGGNTFEKKIVAPNGLQGKADSAGQADETNHAINADNAKKADIASQLVPTGDQTVNNLNVNGYHHVNGDTVVNKLDVNGQLFAHGDVKGFGTITSSKKATGQTWDYGLDVYFDRVGNMVIARIHGGLIAEHGAFTKLQWNIPVGFRPVSETNMLASVGYSKGIIKVFPDGSAWNVDQTFKTSNNNGGDGVPYGFGVWPTLDDFPA